MNKWWIQVYPDTPMTALKEHHIEEFLHSDVSEGRTTRAQHALKWINKWLLKGQWDCKKINWPKIATPASNAVGATAKAALEIHPAMFMELEKTLEKAFEDGEELALGVLSCWLCAAACLRQKHCCLSRLVVQYQDYSLWWCSSGKTKATRQGFYWYMSNFTSSGFNWCERYVGFLKDRNERSPQFVASPGMGSRLTFSALL